jgi:hypothetical protein
MKKIIILLVGIGVIVGLIFLAMNLSRTSKVSDKSLISFAIQDTSSVDKISIYDNYFDRTFTVVRNEKGLWEDQEGNCVQQNIIQMMLGTMNKITLKGYVPKSAMENMKKQMMSRNKEVKIFQDGQWVKTWYVGHPTQDHMGTHMLLETPEKKSDNPVIMGMKGFYGILDPRFFTDPRKFVCSELFSLKREEIKKVKVVNRVIPSESFEVNKMGSNYKVTSMGLELKNINSDNLLFYLNGFQNIHYNQPNYTLSPEDIKKMKGRLPDYELDILSTDNESYELDLYRRLDPESDKDTTVYDKDYLWAVKDGGDVVRMQYYTVGPLIEGQTVFVDNSVNN